MLNKPKLLAVTTCIGCPNNCKYCPQDILVRNYRLRSTQMVFSFNDFKKCLRSVPKDVRIDFSGFSEPWLNKDCTKMLLYSYHQGYQIAVYTTGIGMTNSDVEAIRNIPFTVFSLHLADGQHISNILVNKNYLDLVKKLSSSIPNISFMCLGRLHPKLEPLFGQKLQETHLISRANNVKGFPKISKNGPVTCSFAEWPERTILLPNGDVVLCCSDFGLTETLGNLLHDNYQDIFKNPPFKKVLKRMSDQGRGDIICRHCEYAIASPHQNIFQRLKKILSPNGAIK